MPDTSTTKPNQYVAYGIRAAFSVTFWFAVTAFASVLLVIFHFGVAPGVRWGWGWWADVFAVVTNLCAGALVSFLFYYLVVHYPEQRKRKIIKGNLMRMYRSIKHDILLQVVQASIKGGRYDLSADMDTLDGFMTPSAFRAAFAGGREADEGFYAFENQMSYDTPEFQEIGLNFQMLSKQVEFVLHNYTLKDERLFDYFKRLELVLLRLQQSGPGYDESKTLCRFIYEICAGWDWIDGYRDYDIIEKMIADI